MSAFFAVAATAAPLATGWTLHALRLRRRVEVARRDPLTGLMTRDGFEQRARKSLGYGPRAVYVIDLNGFKRLNDRFGHAAGDTVLRATAQRIARWADGNAGHAARLGGDEFAAVATVLSGPDLLETLNDLYARLVQPIDFEGQSLGVTASVGAIRFDPAGGEADLSVLLRRADEAMYAAKRAGGGYVISTGALPILHTLNGRRSGRPGTSLWAGEAA